MKNIALATVILGCSIEAVSQPTPVTKYFYPSGEIHFTLEGEDRRPTICVLARGHPDRPVELHCAPAPKKLVIPV